MSALIPLSSTAEAKYDLVVLPKDANSFHMIEYKLNYYHDSKYERIDLYEAGAKGKGFELLGVLGDINEETAREILHYVGKVEHRTWLYSLTSFIERLELSTKENKVLIIKSKK
jgi:hypothetical protein